MIFNEQYNKLVYMMIGMDNEFRDDFTKFVADLPTTVRNKCKRMHFFKLKKNDYKYIFDEYDDSELELMVETEVSFDHSLNLYKLNEEDLTKMQSMKKNDFGVFETTRENGECLGYLFCVKKIGNKYYLSMEVTSSNPESDKKIDEEISLHDLLLKVRGKKR